MKTKQIKIWLDPKDAHKLVEKAKEAGFEGRGSISHYIEKIAREPICFLDNNLMGLLKVLDINKTKREED